MARRIIEGEKLETVEVSVMEHRFAPVLPVRELRQERHLLVPWKLEFCRQNEFVFQRTALSRYRFLLLEL